MPFKGWKQVNMTSDSKAVRLKDLSIDEMVVAYFCVFCRAYWVLTVGFLLLKYSVVCTVESLFFVLSPFYVYLNLYVLRDDKSTSHANKMYRLVQNNWTKNSECLWSGNTLITNRKQIHWHREEEPHNNHETPGRQTKQNNQLSLPHPDDCKTRMGIK